MGLVCERRKFQQLRNARADHGIFHAEVTAIHQQVFGAGEIRVQRIGLAHHANFGLDRQAIFGHVQARTLPCKTITDAAAIRRSQPQRHADGGGFTGAVGANHAQAFTRCDGK